MENFTVSEFLEMESEVWEAMKDGNMERDAEMLSDDFLGIYTDGFSDKNEHVGQLAHGPVISSYELMEAKIIVLSEHMVLLSYLAELKRINDGKIEESEKMYVSSIWSNVNGNWKNIFSQDTPTND